MKRRKKRMVLDLDLVGLAFLRNADAAKTRCITLDVPGKAEAVVATAPSFHFQLQQTLNNSGHGLVRHAHLSRKHVGRLCFPKARCCPCPK